MNVEPKTETQIMAALMALTHAYASGDYRRVLALYAPDADTVAFGPTIGEKWIGPAAIAAAYERELKNYPESDLEFVWVSISSVGAVAWVAADCKAHVKVDGRVLLLEGRFSAVFERRGERWLIMHSHFSFPAAM
ncbi:MAG: nuclear transport factor 2 family protein [Deltaproteobacteria bacterium]|nr:nuclear transport factor 2 family protein [Deltaproteobacteria bacterium]